MDVEDRKDERRSVGQRLRDAREEQGRTLGQVEQAIKVHAHHMEALEQENHEALPNPLWARGFLLTYGNYLGLDGKRLADELIPLEKPSRSQRYVTRHWRAFVAALGLVGVAAAMVVAAFVAPFNPFTNWVGGGLQNVAPGIFLSNGPQRIAILGSAQSGAVGQDNVLVVEVAERGIGLRSIPRDTQTNIPGYGNIEIGDTFAMGGPDLTRRSVAKLTGAEVPFYCEVSTEGIREIVGAMGGVKIDVPPEASGRASLDGKTVTLRPGQRTINGDQVLVYLRGADLSSDAARAKRQQGFLYAMFRQALGPLNVLENPSTLKAVYENTETNMSGVQLIQLASRVRALKADGASVSIAEEEASRLPIAGEGPE